MNQCKNEKLLFTVPKVRNLIRNQKILLLRKISKTPFHISLYLNNWRYEPVQARVIRHFERLGVTPADPRNYSALYGNSLLDTEKLLTQIRELGITEDIVCNHSLKIWIMNCISSSLHLKHFLKINKHHFISMNKIIIIILHLKKHKPMLQHMKILCTVDHHR
jgi:hypothetical protein